MNISRGFSLIKIFIFNLRYHIIGKCNICRFPTLFLCRDIKAARNNMYCMFCLSYSRKRHVAKILVELFNIKNIKELSNDSVVILNADTEDSFTKVLRNCNTYYCSSLIPKIKTGTEISKRVFCQDLQKLTFPDEMFDVVITEDVFEHIREDEKGFKEVHRVLKKGGHHIFTIPFNFDMPTEIRVDTTSEDDVFILPPQFHGDKIRENILTYRNYGLDTFERLNRIGFETRVYFSQYQDIKNGIVNSFVFSSKKIDGS